MAVLSPEWATINKFKPPPTEGERALLAFLEETLDDEYEVFFQPYLNGDFPDVVLLRRGGGALVIEVKDWELDRYRVDARKRWHVRKNDTVVKSPVEQVLQYKQNLYDLHIDDLLELKLRDYRYWYVVSCALYFHKAEREVLYRSITEPVPTENGRRARYQTFLNKNVHLFGRDSLNEDYLNEVLTKTWISRRSKVFTDDLYESFQRRLTPSWHSLENTRSYNLDKDQARLVESRPGDQKVRGLAGSGKTLVLAHRAVNAHVRTGAPVLVLTYNITLKNYIHDRVSGVRQEFDWSNFRILNYHDFIGSAMNNVGIPFSIPNGFDNWTGERRDRYFEDSYYSNLDLFEGKQDRLQKYPAILIDEFQDYREAWARMIKKYFLKDGGEFVIFADYGQDIYGRGGGGLEVTPVLGRWNELKKPHRFQNPRLKTLNVLYKQAFFADRYEDAPEDAALTLFGDAADARARVEYYWLDELDLDTAARGIVSRAKALAVHPNDVCVMSMSVETLRELDHRYRALTHERTTTMCETVEFYGKVEQDCEERFSRQSRSRNGQGGSRYPGQADPYANGRAVRGCVRKTVKSIRKHKKWHFWMNSGTVKFSTVHSLKGWESHTLFFVLEGGMMEESLAELIYTGFTRCTNNLIIFNVGNRDFDAFMHSASESVGIEFRTLAR